MVDWTDRIQKAVWTSPQGNRFEFDYEDVSQAFDLNGTVYTFPEVEGQLAQFLKPSGFRYPLQMFFAGANYDTTTKAFILALRESGISLLEHPAYGTIRVVPLGSVSRVDKLVNEANQAVVSLTFFDTVEAIYPNSQDDGNAIVAQALEDFNAGQAEEFAGELDIDSQAAAVSLASRFKTGLDGVKSVFEGLTEAEKAVNDQFLNVYNSINGAITILVADPVTLAFQTAILLQTPGLMAQALGDRLEGYKNVIEALIGGENSIQSPTNDTTAINNFKNDDLYAASSLSGYSNSLINFTFSTKREALEAADELLTLSANWAEWREANYNSLSVVDTGGTYQVLQNLVASTAGLLIQISFSLKQEIFIVLDRDRQFIELCAELYSDIDDDILNFFIDTNELAGDEYIELKKGREVVYYI